MTPRADAPRLFKDQWSPVYLIGWHGQLAFHAHHVCCMLWYDDMSHLCYDMLICHLYDMIGWYVTFMLWYVDMSHICYDKMKCYEYVMIDHDVLDEC